MKQVFVIPFVLAVAAALGYMTLKWAARPIHVHEMTLAMAPSLLAGMTAIAPALLQRPFGAAAVVQGAFYGMIIHLVMTLFLGVALFMLFRIHGEGVTPYALWLMWFFWVSLSAVAYVLIRLIRTTPIALPKQ